MLYTLRAGGGEYVVREATRDDVPALAALFGADPVSARRGDGPGGSGPGDLDDYHRAFAAIDADPRHLLEHAAAGAR